MTLGSGGSGRRQFGRDRNKLATQTSLSATLRRHRQLAPSDDGFVKRRAGDRSTVVAQRSWQGIIDVDPIFAGFASSPIFTASI